MTDWETVNHNAQDNLDGTAHPVFGYAAAGEGGIRLKSIKGENWPWGSCQAFIERS